MAHIVTYYTTETYRPSWPRDVSLLLIGSLATAFFTAAMPGWLGLEQRSNKPATDQHADQNREQITATGDVAADRRQLAHANDGRLDIVIPYHP